MNESKNDKMRESDRRCGAGSMASPWNRAAAVMERALVNDSDFLGLVRDAQSDFGLDWEAARNLVLEYILGLFVREYGLDADNIKANADG